MLEVVEYRCALSLMSVNSAIVELALPNSSDSVGYSRRRLGDGSQSDC